MYLKAVLFSALLSGLLSSSLWAAPVATINGVDYYTTSTSDFLNVDLSSVTGVPTVNSYASYDLVQVGGFGRSGGQAPYPFQDAFFMWTVGGHSITFFSYQHDPNYNQLRYSHTPMAADQPQFDVVNSIVYDSVTGMQVSAPYVPAYIKGDLLPYTLVIDSGALSQLYFGESSIDFTDFQGSLSVQITQLAPLTSTPEPASIAFILLGGAIVALRLRPAYREQISRRGQ